MRTIKAEFQRGGEELVQFLGLLLGFFLFGLILATAIIRFADDATAYPLGSVMVLIGLVLLNVFLGGMGWAGSFQLAIAMGRARRGLIAARYALSLAETVLGVLLLFVLNRLELVYYPAIFPGIRWDDAALMIHDLRWLVPFALAAPVLSLLISAIYGRYQRKGFYIVYFTCFGLFLLGNRILSQIRKTPEGILARLWQRFVSLFGGVGPGVWICLGILALAAILTVSLRLLLRQSVQM